MAKITKIEKRDGRIVDFDQEKITNAIFKAALAVGGRDRERAKFLSDQVVKELERKFGKRKIPTVEEIQDIVEKVLIEHGHAKTAKAYILYRQKKAEIREEKKRILNKDRLDDIDKKLSVNALRVLAYRYLIRDEEGNIIESPRELFQRVAITMVLPEILYDDRVYSKEGKYKPHITVASYLSNLDALDKKIRIGKYVLTKWHLERFIAAYEELANEGKMKVGFDELIAMIKSGAFDDYEKLADRYFDLMVNQVFLPNTPTLVNAGRKLGMLSACFTLDVEDSIDSIMETAKEVALIQKAGGGTGINFSKIRPEGDIVRSTMGKASGPVSFMKIIDAVSEVVKQGGVRRGANMGILEIWHPDIEKFISAKEKEGILENFNISVGIWEDFWEYLANNANYPLINPRTKKVWKEVNANTLFHSIAYHAWLSADPGVVFFDNINKRNVLIGARNGPVRVTNPCGEEPLYPYESCNLASINVDKFVKKEEHGLTFDWEKFREVVHLVVRALDNLITINNYPIKAIDRATKETRRIGLGIMGLADLLFELGIRYNSKEGFEFMGKLAEHLTYYAYEESIKLAQERGSFPLFNLSDYKEGKMPIDLYYHRELWTLDWDKLVSDIVKKGLRNAMVTTMAPTGSISMIADTSNGIEPVFALVYEKKVTAGSFFYIDKVLEKKLKEKGIYSEEIIKKISENYGSVQGLDEIPDDIKNVFVTAYDIHWLDHLVAQAVIQRATTDSISKTINMPNDASVEDVKQAFLIAHALGCKGVTIYRDGSKRRQVLSVPTGKRRRVKAKPSEYAINLLKKILENNRWMEKFIRIREEKKGVEIKPPVVPAEESLEVERIPIRREDIEKCPVCGSVYLVHEGKCLVCKECGWNECVVG
ncbi:MAG: ribonucleoside-diphosphate reductase, adenosylcobalamin-dependent [Thermoplasmata archaeon]|nr:MAG: ribonucleoside-diphosphate reductase, adenosylcobalamin-dependent [Thermoplasmata archaeon]RLF39770.1 MAG: ribonucleoside-diphosphate reductase, adenosylcobalamin-dependent [Thermoplasmata archaeon]